MTKLERFLGLIAVGTMVASASFAGYHYKEIHLVDYEVLATQVNHHQCIQQCENVCRQNNIPLDSCNCSHCHVYR